MTRFLLACAMASVLLAPAALAEQKETNRERDLYNYGSNPLWWRYRCQQSDVDDEHAAEHEQRWRCHPSG